MGESQSRYSIVERLTSKKLDIISARSELKEQIRDREQYVEKLKKELENWKKDVQEDTKREQRRKELEIERSLQEVENAKSQMKEKDALYEEQIKAVNVALQSIEEISKTSPTVQS